MVLLATCLILRIPAGASDVCEHIFAKDIREPGCVTPGMWVEYCVLCGAVGRSESLAPLGHDMSPWYTAVEPGCTEPGEERSVCSRCGFCESRAIDQTGHLYDDGVLTKEPTATTVGRITFTCLRCGDSYEKTIPKWKNPFSDVKPRHYFYDSVLWAFNNGITSGVAPDRFGPEQVCTRGQVMVFLWRSMGSPEPASPANPFSDVKGTDYYADAVLWAYHAGVTAGVDAGHFAPDQPCTRGQVVTFLYSAKGKPAVDGTVEFSDVSHRDYYHAGVLWASANHITAGVGGGRFAPGQQCTRSQIVTFLYQARTV